MKEALLLIIGYLSNECFLPILSPKGELWQVYAEGNVRQQGGRLRVDHLGQAPRHGDESEKILSLIFQTESTWWISLTSHTKRTMAAGWLPVLMFTLIWGLVGGVAPRFVPHGPHRSLIQVYFHQLT